MSKYLTPEWQKKIFVSDGERIEQTNMWIYNNGSYPQTSNWFICDANGDPLDSDGIPFKVDVPEEEIETPETICDEIETPEDPADDLLCPHCGARARTKRSYLKNHGDNCSMKV